MAQVYEVTVGVVRQVAKITVYAEDEEAAWAAALNRAEAAKWEPEEKSVVLASVPMVYQLPTA